MIERPRSHLVVASQCGYMQGGESAAAQLLHIRPSVEKRGHQLCIILRYTNK